MSEVACWPIRHRWAGRWLARACRAGALGAGLPPIGSSRRPHCRSERDLSTLPTSTSFRNAGQASTSHGGAFGRWQAGLRFASGLLDRRLSTAGEGVLDQGDERVHARAGSRASMRTSGQPSGRARASRTARSPKTSVRGRRWPRSRTAAPGPRSSRSPGSSRRSGAGRPGHRPDRALGQLVPHEPEPRLAGGAEQVQDQLPSTVMRKSIATVVVVLSGTTAVSSIPTDSEVSCSVVSGGISDTARQRSSYRPRTPQRPGP